MLTCFYIIDSGWQIFLLVLCLLTVFSFVGSIVFLYKRGYRAHKLPGIVLAFLLNTALYVVMQLDSRITGAEQGVHLHIPYVVLLAIVLLSLLYNVYTLLSETKGRKKINRNSIKEAFDNLPIGVCFFNADGLPVLCNLAMHRLSFAVCGNDVQFITDLAVCTRDDFVPYGQVKKEGNNFVLPDGNVWQLKERCFTHDNGNTYTQYVAVNITTLYQKRKELERENEQLRRAQEELQRLSANVVAVTREEEILNTKMRVHDEMGRCLVAAQKYLKEKSESIPDSLAASWQRAVSMLKYSNDTPDEDMLLQIRKTCAFVQLKFVQNGELPTAEKLAYILTCAVRECVTNAVRYAEATELCATFAETDTEASVTIVNNGKRPEKEVAEGGGLSSLRARVERAGGQMLVQSFPEFKLTVSLPKGREGML